MFGRNYTVLYLLGLKTGLMTKVNQNVLFFGGQLLEFQKKDIQKETCIQRQNDITVSGKANIMI